MAVADAVAGEAAPSAFMQADDGLQRWADAALVAALLAVDGAGLGGVHLKAWPGPVRDRWVGLFTRLMGADRPIRRLPVQTPEGRLLGGLDLSATLEAGRPVVARGLLAEADGGAVIAAMAERMMPETAGCMGQAMDLGRVRLERDGAARQDASRFALVAIDEALPDEDGPPPALLDRLAFRLDLSGLRYDQDGEPAITPAEIVAARTRLPMVETDESVLAALCRTAAALGIASVRAEILALRAARALAALNGRTVVDEGDAVAAARLVLSPRARQLPAPPPDPDTQSAPSDASDRSDEPDLPSDPDAADDDGPRHDPPEPPDRPDDTETETGGDSADEDRVVEAARAAIPQDLLNRLLAGRGAKAASRGNTRQGLVAGARRGRPSGVRRGEPRSGERLNVIETLRAAAPWQGVRTLGDGDGDGDGDARAVQVRKDDFRLTRFKQRAESTTIFVVDASGSAALARLAEAKGAVELLLADCYVRRDEVALIAFRGTRADLLLPPTRSSARAKRSLSALPGGGGTPMALGLEAAAALAVAERRRGRRPQVIVLSDGGANVDRQGRPGREQAHTDALTAAQTLRREGISALFVDTADRGRARARALAQAIAQAMGADYLPLPSADAASLSSAVRARRAPAADGGG